MIRLSSSQEVQFRLQVDMVNPLGTSQEYLKFVRFERFPPPQAYLDLLSTYLPNVECIVCADEWYNSKYNDARQRTSFTFDFSETQIFPYEY